MQKLLIAVLFFAALNAISAETEIDKDAITGAYNRFPFRSKKFVHVTEPSQLNLKEVLTDTDKEIVSIADSIFRSSPYNLGMMLIGIWNQQC